MRVDRDYDQIANLIFYESNNHRHLDWHSPLEWIGSPNYWVLEEEGTLPLPWLAPKTHSHGMGPFLWHHRISRIRPGLHFGKRTQRDHTANTQQCCRRIKQWFQTILLSSGFELKQNIVLPS
jgi:hypothetical protein